MTCNKIELAYRKGFRVINNMPYNPDGKRLKVRLNTAGYPVFAFRPSVKDVGKRCMFTIPLHRLVAYQKYGALMFEPNTVVRHRDSNPLNALSDNILIGTPSDNMMDKSKESRRKQAIIATTKNRILSDEEVIKLKYDRHVLGMTYQQLSDKYGIGNKGQAYYVANHEYVSKK